MRLHALTRRDRTTSRSRFRCDLRPIIRAAPEAYPSHMLCEDIMMDDVVCLALTDTAHTAARKMRDLNVGFLPVCDAVGKVVGTLTDRDLTIRLIAENRSLKTSVSTLMTPEVITCRPKEATLRAQSLRPLHHKSRIAAIRDGGP